MNKIFGPVVSLGVLLLASPASCGERGIIVDHTCTDIRQLPASAVEQARKNLHIACGHTSHGSQIVSGMSGLEAEIPNVRFVYVTGHLNGPGPAGNVNIRNNQIREFCRSKGKVLHDFAEIESFGAGRKNQLHG